MRSTHKKYIKEYKETMTKPAKITVKRPFQMEQQWEREREREREREKGKPESANTMQVFEANQTDS